MQNKNYIEMEFLPVGFQSHKVRDTFSAENVYKRHVQRKSYQQSNGESIYETIACGLLALAGAIVWILIAFMLSR